MAGLFVIVTSRTRDCSLTLDSLNSVAKALCPELIFLDLDFELYTSCSKSIMKILGEYGDMSKASLDEACKSGRDHRLLCCSNVTLIRRFLCRYLVDGLLQA